MSGSGISWAICKSAPSSRQITTPAPHHSVFYRPDALPAAQPTASKHWRDKLLKIRICIKCTQITITPTHGTSTTNHVTVRQHKDNSPRGRDFQRQKKTLMISGKTWLTNLDEFLESDVSAFHLRLIDWKPTQQHRTIMSETTLRLKNTSLISFAKTTSSTEGLNYFADKNVA